MKQTARYSFDKVHIAFHQLPDSLKKIRLQNILLKFNNLT